MRLVDTIFRQGHLSEQALIEALVTGERPAHLDVCDICADRARQMNLWLDTVRDVAVEAADEAFPAERLAAQQAQILRRIEQLDEPSRVIAFPGRASQGRQEGGRRIAVGWLGVAAAAGLVVGAIGGQMSVRLDRPAPTTAAAIQQQAEQTSGDLDLQAMAAVNTALFEIDFDSVTPEPLTAINDITPRLLNRQ